MAHVINKYFDQLKQSVCDIIKFDSSLKPAEENAPFGKETAECLQFFLDLAKSMGFETKNYDNYIGEVIFGEGKEFAILAHLDVVPAGNGWKYPPFGGVINSDPSDSGVLGEKIWGRGALDDKGPAVSCLYCLKALKDEGVIPNRKIKLIVGCNEESGWACIEYYKKVAKLPEEGFTPDADFPAIYAEKGILHFDTAFALENPPFTALQAGERVNMVCDYASAIITKKAAAKLVGYENPIAGTTFSYDNTTNILQVRGKSAHASAPWVGNNALQAMMAFFASFDEGCKRVYDLLFADVLNLKTMQDETGPLTMSPDMAVFKNGVLTVTTDIRFPATHQKEEILDAFASVGATVSILNYQAPLYNNPNGSMISTLMKVYNKALGVNEKPIAIGGGTYARALPCGCGFGPELPGVESTIHQANEYVSLDHLRKMTEIYYDAIKELVTSKQTIRIGSFKKKLFSKGRK